jgi:hypothetical protein
VCSSFHPLVCASLTFLLLVIVQLETALAAERLARMRNKHGNSTSVESDGSLSESTHGRSRSSRSARRAIRAATNRNRSGTASTLAGDSSASADVDSVAISPEAPPRSLMATIPSEQDNDVPLPEDAKTNEPKTPTTNGQVIRRISSGASLSAMNATSSPESAPTPTLTPTISSITEDSDTDFQSACSTSPRDSYVDYDRDGEPVGSKVITIVGEDEHHVLPEKMERVARIPQIFKVRPERHIMKPRSRSSTATTVVSPASPTASDDAAADRAARIAAD